MSLQKLLLFVFVFVFEGFQANARICEQVYARNSVTSLENQLRGCTVVLGNVKIVLFDHPKHDIRNITFPELTEITGFLLFFRVCLVTSIGSLFPNLVVIRGETLLLDYALVIHSLPNLTEIGLSSLRYIARGSTRIEYCPQLCFVDTIDWSKIGSSLHSLDYYNENEDNCPFCPIHCNNGATCWNSTTCQLIPDEKCNSECLGCTKSQPDVCKACKSMYLHQGKCVEHCPENKLRNSATHTCITHQECTSLSVQLKKWWHFNGECLKKCPEYYKQVSEDEGWCQYCGESCYYKTCQGGIINTVSEADDFRDCTHIKGHLEISVSTAALDNELQDVLGKVKEIDGYLKISRSHAISSLYFLKNLRLIRGLELYHGHYSLLVYENQNLRELWNWNNFSLKIEQGNIFFHYNPILCLSEVDKLVDVLGLPSTTITEVSPYSNGERTVCRHVNLKVIVSNLNSTYATLSWQDFVVEIGDLVVGYTVYYIEDPFGTITLADGRDECFEDEWVSNFVKHSTLNIFDLYPYTQYAFYIQVHTYSPASGGFTQLQRFKTLSDIPSEVTQARVILTTSDSITVAWDPPLHPAGIITKYQILLYLEEDNLRYLTEDNNYCFQSHNSFKDPAEEVEDPLEVWTNSSSSCCRKQNWTELKIEKRSASHHTIIDDEINGNITQYEINNLQNFKIYLFMIRACNNASECGPGTLMYQRTQPKVDADDIPPGVSVNVNASNIFIKWLEPFAPNTEILSYLLEYQHIDLQNSVKSLSCVTNNDYQKQGFGHTITNLPPGKYLLTIKAVSLAGPGRSSEIVQFEISSLETLTTTSWAAYLITVIILFVILLASALFYYYKSKKVSNWMLLINPHSVESLFLEIQYELLRKDVDIDQELQGTFGIICNGFIKSQNRPCTIKIIQKNKRELNKLLRDATTMKNFKSYHIVNLLGIVSKDQPALVVMELMAWGDLKSFLKRFKDSNSITHVEMYRMAAEIADGMMYLSSKKFIHVDLAARNCFVSAGHTIKLVNFGINKDLYETDYYKKNTGEVIPVRWMAPESLADGIIATESNVWSYGIILWEIVTFAEQPYGNLLDEEVMRYVIGQKVLEPPPNCPELLYEMMVACWRWRSKHRPIFVNLLRQLQSRVRRDFKLVSFYHSREAAEFKLAAKNREYNLPARRIPLLDDIPSVRWNKKYDEIELANVNQDQSENVPSTSSHVE